MTHGHWKDLFKATGEGDLELMRYHLQCGADPHFQHPEYMSAPLFEALRKEQAEAVNLLVENDETLLAQIEEFSGLQPMAFCLEEQKHRMVDLLLTFSNLPDEQCDQVQTIVLQTNTNLNTVLEQVSLKLLGQGHRVVLLIEAKDDTSVFEGLKRKLIQETGNQKMDVMRRNANTKANAVICLLHSPTEPSNYVPPECQNPNARLVLVAMSDICVPREDSLKSLPTPDVWRQVSVVQPPPSWHWLGAWIGVSNPANDWSQTIADVALDTQGPQVIMYSYKGAQLSSI